MATLDSSGVTRVRQHVVTSRGVEKGVVLDVEVTIASAGTGTTIPASAFGLTYIDASSPWIADDDSIQVVASPNYAKTHLLLKAAGTNAPATYSDTFHCRIWGRN